MRFAFYILLGIHGLIHLFGFLKAFGIVDFEALQQPISKPVGLLWLCGFLLFALTTALAITQSGYWWLSGFIAVLVSQGLILNYWSDAKFGTIANVIILLAVIVGFADYRFQAQIAEERKESLEKAKSPDKEILSEEQLIDLPPVVQKWLTSCGAIGRPKIATVYLKQDLLLKLKPDQKEWSQGEADQYFTIDPPAFNWSIDMKMNSFLPVAGRDKFEDGKGEMTIKLLSVISVADAKGHEKVDQATLQRYLAEIVWFPSAALSNYIRWEELDGSSAKATMSYKGAEGAGVFHFDANGHFEEFVAMRYKDAMDTKPTEWRVRATASEIKNGIRIPTSCEASWVEDGEKETWLKLKVEHIEYDVK
jgi:hypothetical protein